MKAFSIVVLLVFIGCSPSPSEVAQRVATKPQWEMLLITWNNRSVGLDTVKDSLSFFEQEIDSRDPSKGKYRTIYVDKDAQDSIWKAAEHSMQAPVLRSIDGSDNGGDFIRVKFYAHGFGTTQALEYHSQDGWPSVGDLKQLRQLTFDRFGENLTPFLQRERERSH